MTPLTYPGVARLGLAQMALGAVVVLCTSTLNRVMVVEYHLPATLPGALVALHYGVQILRPRMGFGSDRGGRRTPWITGGTAAMAVAAIAAAAAVPLFPAHPILATAASLVAFLLLGAGVGAAGTSLLALVADRAPPGRRAAAATILWIMMIAGIALTAGLASRALAPFSPARLLAVTAATAAAAILLALLATWRMEGEATQPPAPAIPARFRQALRDVWAEPSSRRFALFVFVSMLAYAAQELLLEPLAGAVFALTPAQTAGLTGLQHAGVLAGMLAVALLTTLAGGYGRRAMRLCTTAGCLASAAGAAAVAAITLAGAEAALAPAAFALGAANGAFSVSAIGAMMGLAAGAAGETRPEKQDGTRIGLWGAAQALAFGAGGLLGTATADAARALLGAPAPAYALVFALEAAAFTAAATLAAGLFAQPRRPAAAPTWTMELQP